MVPGEIGILPEYREVTGTPRGVIGPTWASRENGEGRSEVAHAPPFLVGIGEGKGEGERRKGVPPFPCPIQTRSWGGARPPFEAFLSFPVWPIKAQYEFP